MNRDSGNADSAEGIGRNSGDDIGYFVAILGDGVDDVVTKRDVSMWNADRRSRVVGMRVVLVVL